MQNAKLNLEQYRQLYQKIWKDLAYTFAANKCWYINCEDHYDLLEAIFNDSDLQQDQKQIIQAFAEKFMNDPTNDYKNVQEFALKFLNFFIDQVIDDSRLNLTPSQKRHISNNAVAIQHCLPCPGSEIQYQEEQTTEEEDDEIYEQKTKTNTYGCIKTQESKSQQKQMTETKLTTSKLIENSNV